MTVAAGGSVDDSVGYFIDPTVLLIGQDPTDDAFRTEYFGPILAVHVYDDSRPDAFDDILTTVDTGSSYALTGAVIANDRAAIDRGRQGASLRRRKLLRQRQTHRRPWSANNPSAAAAPRAPTTRRDRRRTCCAGPPRARSRKPTSRPPRTSTPTKSPTLPPRTTEMAFTTLLRPALLAAGRSPRLERTIARVPVTKHVVDRFVAGETEHDAVHAARELRDTKRFITIDYLGEDTTDRARADETVQHYLALLPALAELSSSGGDGPPNVEVSLKLSALGQFLPGDGHQIATDNAHRICTAAEKSGVWVTIDAEDHTTTDSHPVDRQPAQNRLPHLGYRPAGLPSSHRAGLS